jgi:hypothetical protein
MIDAERNATVEDSSHGSSPGESDSYSSQDCPVEESTFSEASSRSSDNDQNGSTSTTNMRDVDGPNVMRDVENLTQNFYARMTAEGMGVEERKPLVEFTSELPPIRLLNPNLDLEAIENYVDKLRSDRLILVSCANDQLALESAHAIVGRLDLTNLNQRRYLDFKRTAREKCGPSIDFLRHGTKALEEWAIVIDAVSEPAQTFLDDLLTATGAALSSLSFELDRTRLYLVCIVNNEDVTARLAYDDRSGGFQRECPIPHLHIQFLRPMLQRYYPNEYEELETKIMAIRDRWDPDDRKFRFIIESLIKSGKIKELLKDGPPPQEETVQPEVIFPEDKSARNYVVYVGVYFPGLNPREFQRMVGFLLQDKTITITVSSTIKHDDGKVEKIEIEKERLLLDVWRETMDKVQRESYLVTAPALDAQTVVDFKHHRLRQQLKEYLNCEYSNFLTEQFEQLLNNGVLFDPSVRISENFIQLMAEMITSDPDYYGHEWISRLLSQVEAMSDDVFEPQPKLFPALAGMTTRQTTSLIYRRLSLVIRKLLENQAQEFVNELFEQLIRRRLHQSALELVKRLRFVPQFEEFYWLRQLVERGDKASSDGTFLYLCYYMQSTGARVYTVLDPLDEWIKKDARPEAYSKAAEEALQLIFFYCSSLKFNNNSGSLHPLFAFPDAESATLNLGLVTRNLFHPWMEKSIHSLKPGLRVLASISEFVSDWVFGILGTTAERDATPAQHGTSRISPAETVRILLQQVAASATQEQQERLVKLWRSKSTRLMDRIITLPYGSTGRDELVARRNVLDEMIAQFRVVVPASLI